MRVVFDTNIYISAFAIPGGDAEEAYRHALRGTFDLIASIFILTETARVLQTKFDWTSDRVQQLIRQISQTVTLVKPQAHLHILSDEPDNRILECALESRADFLVTGDRDLLALGQHETIQVITLAQFLAKLQKGAP
ncbi:MAG: putative toxin-antitoxin system toxin component, PIN family [Nitrospirae bacterium]|nr:putative toxin-antitoxin system toxin component, PIN family [Nitrospirota bacterium]